MPVLKYKDQNNGEWKKLSFIPTGSTEDIERLDNAVSNLNNLIDDKSDVGHRHDDIYYNESALNGVLSSYATKDEINDVSSLVGGVAVSVQIANATSNLAQTDVYYATFSASDWSSSAPYTQTVTVNGILSTDTPFVDVDMSNASTSNDGVVLLEAWSFVGRIAVSENNKITAYCYEEKPTIDMPIILKVVR